MTRKELPFWEKSVIATKTVVDVVRDPIIILDGDLRVLSANGPFYRFFQTTEQEIKSKYIYEIGNRQWDIPVLITQLKRVLPEDSFFKGFKVAHVFPHIGNKTLMLSARCMYREGSPPSVLLVIEDITEIALIAEVLAARVT